MGAGAVMPPIATALDVITVLRCTSVWSVNANGFGVVSAVAAVVDENVSQTPPIVTPVLTVVANAADELCRMQIVWPSEIVPALAE
jgi:hypothetical protein